ncbi:unnamed protein product [Closterium sp. NIES-53]
MSRSGSAARAGKHGARSSAWAVMWQQGARGAWSSSARGARGNKTRRVHRAAGHVGREAAGCAGCTGQHDVQGAQSSRAHGSREAARHIRRAGQQGTRATCGAARRAGRGAAGRKGRAGQQGAWGVGQQGAQGSRACDRAGQTCGKPHTQHRCFSRHDDTWCAEFGDEAERPRWAELLNSGVAIFDLDYDAILAAMYALSVSAVGDCYLCVPPDPGASRCFFRDSTTLTPLYAPVPVRIADPSRGPILARSSTVLSCPTVPSGSLSGLHLPSFSTNLLSTAALLDAMVTTTTPGGQDVSICTRTRTGRHLATFTHRPGSSLYTLATKPPQVAASAQVSASSLVAPPSSCRLLSHQTLLWHHRLGHPSLPRLRGMHSCLLVSVLPRSLPPLPPSPAPPCLSCVEGRQRAAPHSSSFPLTTAPLQNLHMDVSPPPHCCTRSRGEVGEGAVQEPLGRQQVGHTRHPHTLPPTAAPAAERWRRRGGAGAAGPLPPSAAPAAGGGRRKVGDLVLQIPSCLPLTSKFPPPLSDIPMEGGEGGEGGGGGAARATEGHAGRRNPLLPPPHPPWRNRAPGPRLGVGAGIGTGAAGIGTGAAGSAGRWGLAPGPRDNANLPVLLLHSDRGGEFSSDLVRDICRGEGILQSFTLPASSQQNGIAERRIGLVIEGKVGDASVFRVWGSRAFVRDTSADKLSARAIPCVFLGFPPDAPGWQFYHPTSRRVLPSHDVTFDESVPFYRAARGAASRGAEPTGAELGGGESEGAGSRGAKHAGRKPKVEPAGAEPEGAEPGGAESEGAETEGAEPRASGAGDSATGGTGAGGAGATSLGGVGAGDPGTGSAGARGTGASGPAGTGAAGAGGAVGVGAGGTGAGAAGGSRAAGPGGARTRGTGAAGAGGAAGFGAGGTGAGAAGGTGAFGTGGDVGIGAGDTRAGGAGPGGGLTERRERVSRPASPVRAVHTGRRVPHPRPPPVPVHVVHTGRRVPQHVQLSSPPASSLADGPDPESDLDCAATPTVPRLLATVVSDPSFESGIASALVAELVDFAAACRLDYAASLVAESESDCPPSVGGDCALGTNVLEDWQEDFEFFITDVPHLVFMLLAPEEDPDAPDIPTPRSYAEAITGPYSSQWETAMDAEMASWKSTGTYVNAILPPGVNIVDGMWIFKVKRPPGSSPAFKARYVARGFSKRQGVNYFQTFSPNLKMPTLRVMLYVAAQRDYELHSLDFSTAFLQNSLHEEIWLRRPPGFTGSFPAGTQWSLQWLVYGLRQAHREWHDTLRTTLAALGFVPSTADLLLFLNTDTSLPPFYVLVYVDDLVFATADTEALALMKLELQKRHTCTDLGELRSYVGLHITWDRARRTITLTQSHMVHQSVEPSGPYPELVGCLMYLMTCTRPDLAYPLSIMARYVAPGRHRPEHWEAAERVLRYMCSTSGMGLVLGGRGPVVLTGHADASWVDDLATHCVTLLVL